MKNIAQHILSKINKTELQSLLTISDIYKENGYSLYLVGGAIRDALLNKNIKDCDLATNAPLEETKRMFSKIVPKGEDHGTLSILENGFEFEVTRFRKDVSTDGRKATIEYAETIEEDLSRRDLTINGMALDLHTHKFIDIFNGYKDIKNKQINFILEAQDRIQEDHLRSIRFLRFLVKYPDFNTDFKNIMALNRFTNLKVVSVERIVDELQKMISYNFIPSKNILVSLINIGVLRRLNFKIEDIKNLKKIFEVNDLFPLILQNYIENNKSLDTTWNNIRFDKNKYRNMISIYEIIEEKSSNQFLYEEIFNYGKNITFEEYFEYISKINSFKGYSIPNKEYLLEIYNRDIRLKDLNINGNDLIELQIEPNQRHIVLKSCLKEVWNNPTNNNKEYLLEYIKKLPVSKKEKKVFKQIM